MNTIEENTMNTPNEREGRRRGHHHPRRGGPRMGEGMPMHRGRGGRGPGRGSGRGRAPRGDVRTAVLMLLAEEPMHGYQLMQAIADRSGGRWTPSPGAIYPTLNQLEDEGLVTVTAESGRRLATLTESGQEHVAARQVARNGSDAQRAAAAEILGGARRSLYLLLADGAEPTKPAEGAAD